MGDRRTPGASEVAELFHHATDFAGARPMTTLGVRARYHFDKNYDLLGYVAHDLRKYLSL
jgi:hypothetical protein